MTSSERIQMGIKISKLLKECVQFVESSDINEDIKYSLLHSLNESAKDIRSVLTIVYVSKL